MQDVLGWQIQSALSHITTLAGQKRDETIHTARGLRAEDEGRRQTRSSEPSTGSRLRGGLPKKHEQQSNAGT